MLRQLAGVTLRSTPLRHSLSTLSRSRQPSFTYLSSAGTTRCRRNPPSGAYAFTGVSAFHSTPRNEAAPIIPFLITALKTSTALELARTAGRFVLTFVPLILLKNAKARRLLRKGNLHGNPVSEEKKQVLLTRIKYHTLLFHFLISIPIVLFWATIFASLERTPLTGRWRMIVLSPEEEDSIADQLAGPGWYKAVGEILSQDGPPRLVPPNDWRYIWVKTVLRQLESTIPLLMRERELPPEWLTSDRPMPPPAQYPLLPRPRASEYLRWMCDSLVENEKSKHVAHTIPGPPYSLLVVDKPDASNAFSYGFGPDGGGGIVVYSGFLDEILSRTPFLPPPREQPSFWSSLFGGFLSSAPPSAPHPIPTEKQTSELAILLAHELAHLVLSHHLETLSSATVFVPGTLSIIADFLRVLIFPVTMLFGPFVNDAVAQLGKAGSMELNKLGEYCTSIHQEIEADVVSARLLAHAGFDPRHAVAFWENRYVSPTECAHADYLDSPKTGDMLMHRIMGSTHPVNEVRVEKLKSELVRWEVERRAAIAKSQSPAQESSIILATA